MKNDSINKSNVNIWQFKKFLQPKTAFWIDLCVKFIEVLVIISSIYITYTLLKDIVQGTSFNLYLILLFMIIIGSAYILLIVRDFFLQKAVDLNRITILIYLIIFYFSLFAGIVVFKNNQPSPIIPKLPIGTVGLRTFGCGVTFRNIEISYLDSNNIWQKIPSEITNDSSSWILNQFQSFGKHPAISYFQPSKDTSNSLVITLNNSGAIFNNASPKVSQYFKGAQFFKVSTFITVDSNYINIDSSYEYADIYICMNVPLKRENKNKEGDELYLGFALPIKNIYNAKFWIPALEWRSGSVYRDPISKLNENGFYDDLSLHREYNFIGVRFSNSARILLRNKDKSASSIICESKFDSNE